MLRDVLIPNKIGTYYLFSKRVLSFNVTPILVQGVLIEYSGYKIQIKNNVSISLKDFSTHAQINAIKKIATSIGKYDEVVTTLSSSVVSFKELQLPFFGRDKLEMVVAYEVESLLPFSIDDAVLDFIITAEDHEKKLSTVLVAAVRKEDVDVHYELFEKADIALSVLTIDLFALYTLYFSSIYQQEVVACGVVKKFNIPQDFIQKLLPSPKNSVVLNFIYRWKDKYKKTKNVENPKNLQVTQPVFDLKQKRVELLVDIGFEVVRVLYMQNGRLCAVRMIPLGVSDIAQSISKQTGISYYDIACNLVLHNEVNIDETILGIEIEKLLHEVVQTMQFFEKQNTLEYIPPQKVLFAGFGCHLVKFLQEAQKVLGNSVCLIDIEAILKVLRIKEFGKNKIIASQFFCLSLATFTNYEIYVNFLKNFAHKSGVVLFNKQFLCLICMSCLVFGGAWWRSSTILQKLETSYNSSKKQLVQTVTQKLAIDLSKEKSLKTIVDKTEDAFKKEKILWFSFSRKNERSILQYLQDLSIHIDKASLGLELNQVHIDYDKVILTGSVTSIEAVEVFTEELMELKLFNLQEKPREASFTVQLKAKDSSVGQS